MKFSAAATILAMAVTAFAAPADLNARTDPAPPTPPPEEGDICPNNNQQVCCTGILTCVVQVLGQSCSSDVFCCQTNAPTGALVNIALLNCVDIL